MNSNFKSKILTWKEIIGDRCEFPRVYIFRDFILRCFLLLFFIHGAFANFNRTSGLIDIPSAGILSHLNYRIGLDGSVAFNNGFNLDKNCHGAFGYKDLFEFYIDIYTLFGSSKTIAAGFCHRFYEREKLACAWGIHDLSYSRDLCELGQGNDIGWADDLTYNHGLYRKPFELGSMFAVSSYHLNNAVEINVGIGRGRYVGYGEHSRWFNSNFYHDRGGNWGIGLFSGFVVRPTQNVNFMLEMDGRDLNLGFVYFHKPVEISLGIAKFEYLFSRSFSPSILTSISYTKRKETVKSGSIAGTVFDNQGNKIAAEVNLVNGNIESLIANPLLGTFIFDNLTSGIYQIYARADGYIETKKEVMVIAGKTVYCHFELEKEELLGSIEGRVVNAQTKGPIKARIFVMELDLSVESDSSGTFEINGIKPNDYQIITEADGYVSNYCSVPVYTADKTMIDITMVQKGMVIIFSGINFSHNSVNISPESYEILNEAARVIINHPDINIEIRGHTDSIGSRTYNLQLSNARANVVRNYLIEHHNIEPFRLTARGYGEDSPVASNATMGGRNQNRRVDFLILK